jgi:S-adenosylmethionine:tRNA ribosyltransferase-isomerase
MKVSDFDYELPAEHIAQEPVRPRDAARLLVHRVDEEGSEHARVRDLGRFLRAGDLLIVNDTRVRPARLAGSRPSGGAVELLLLEPAGGARWRTLARPAAKLRSGEELELEGGRVRATPIERGEGGEWLVELADATGGAGDSESFEELLERVGRMPLPPYIARPRGDDPQRAFDREAYQTVFARELGAAAAPTAGLHFTTELLTSLERAGVERAAVTLHVGVGTFRPVMVDDTEAHRMHAETYDLPVATVEAVARCRARGGRVVAVGTTSVRVLETCAREAGELRAGAGETRLFLTPGSGFQVVDALLTNFHLPRSTLLMLVSAFAGRERVLALYAEAIEAGYRFYSYGDAMLLLR